MSRVWNGNRFVHRKTRNAASQQLARKRILKARGSKCESCEFDGYVELHHKKRAVDGGDFADDNLILLCIPCHQEADRGNH